jgi:RHS repeat-associated protein
VFFYTYTGARADISGRGFLGFKSQTMIDSRNNAKVQTLFQTAFPYTGMVSQQDQYRTDGFGQWRLISHTVNTPAFTPLDASVNNQRYFPYVASTATDTYEVGWAKEFALITQSSASFTYDTYGNLTALTSTVTDKDSTAPQSPTYNQSWTTTVTNTITPNTATWCLGLPTQTAVTKSATGVSAITRTTAFTPDYAMCRMTQQLVEPNSPTYKVTTTYAYDDDAGNPAPDFGNITSMTVTGINMPARTTTVDWGATGQFPISVINPLLQLTAAGYDYNKGVQTSQTDPNGLITVWEYDSFGRKNKETHKDATNTAFGSFAVWNYADCASVSGGCQNGDPNSLATGINKMVVTATVKDAGGVAISDQLTYLDQLDRPIVTKSKLLNGGYSRVGVQYDSLGRKYRQTAPCDAASCSAYWNTYGYDAFNRVTQMQRPTSASNPAAQYTNVSYQGMTTVTTDPQGKISTQITDPNGWMRQTQDANGYAINFTYDAFGSLKTVIDSASNALFSASYAYGIGAFQTQTVDMDLGTWNYTPDALGQVANYTDAKGSLFTMTYDSLSRPLTRSVPGQATARWIWGTNAAAREIGQLAKQCVDTSVDCSTAAIRESYLYDSAGRLSQKDILAAGTTYSYNYAYNNASGSLDTLTYPTSTSGYRLALKYAYQNGLLQQVKDNAASTIFWQANAMNPMGQITQETLGNGIVTNRNYDAVTGWINTLQSGVGGGTGVQNEAYLFDKVGNVTQRQNNTLGLTESFYYDNVYRLDYSQLNGVTNLDMTYDNLGNITNRTDMASNATWTYDATKKHAVLQAGSSSNVYTYDANGNAISRNGWTLAWNKSNALTSISKPGFSFSFSYDGNNQRWRQVNSDIWDTTTTIYLGGLLEKTTSASYGTADWRHYIKVGSQTVAVYSRKGDGGTALRYVLEDHQGSIAKITDTAGATYVSESFTAFGDRRNPATWSGAPTSGDTNNINAVTRFGYTGQEALGSLGLTHMNGRVQDAITGRFLSPDPYITQPGNTQNYNRYSYVYNNPVSFTDPSGYSSLKTGDYDENGALVIVITQGCCDSLSGSFSGSWGSYAQNPVNNPNIFQQNYESYVSAHPETTACSSCNSPLADPFANTLVDYGAEKDRAMAQLMAEVAAESRRLAEERSASGNLSSRTDQAATISTDVQAGASFTRAAIDATTSTINPKAVPAVLTGLKMTGQVVRVAGAVNTAAGVVKVGVQLRVGDVRGATKTVAQNSAQALLGGTGTLAGSFVAGPPGAWVGGGAGTWLGGTDLVGKPIANTVDQLFDKLNDDFFHMTQEIYYMIGCPVCSGP